MCGQYCQNRRRMIPSDLTRVLNSPSLCGFRVLEALNTIDTTFCLQELDTPILGHRVLGSVREKGEADLFFEDPSVDLSLFLHLALYSICFCTSSAGNLMLGGRPQTTGTGHHSEAPDWWKGRGRAQDPCKILWRAP